ncbi:MAG: hypothetical protein A2669_00045 [Candidatus Yanofskybacteria bacterium RIFCSPHIGHO2_01_FULL_48_25b]|uniref:Uncharacterized protein n=1 Tax=Candidatus Yanofskybacteria bacterium RIFCSPHIGHO2_01_FULL_48_25b TaxID=1802672 RepID=A0A1F8F0S1_9BACT|nr:MAG: hypothetical protein A2669_00045 [Candidatus Yanofskybacteria bacterium RIFCSPHIGHO2_01_FULL_48_25b]
MNTWFTWFWIGLVMGVATLVPLNAFPPHRGGINWTNVTYLVVFVAGSEFLGKYMEKKHRLVQLEKFINRFGPNTWQSMVDDRLIRAARLVEIAANNQLLFQRHGVSAMEPVAWPDDDVEAAYKRISEDLAETFRAKQDVFYSMYDIADSLADSKTTPLLMGNRDWKLYAKMPL